MKKLCGKRVYGGSFSGHPCRNGGKVKEAGEWWCGVHQPSKVKARQKARDAKFTREWKAKNQRWARARRVRDAEGRLLDGVMELDPIPVGCEWLGKLIEAVKKARGYDE